MTTHTMEEVIFFKQKHNLKIHLFNKAESLCNKIGILINGQFYTVGSPEQLRNKYGSGYNITFNLNKANQNKTKEILQSVFPKIV